MTLCSKMDVKQVVKLSLPMAGSRFLQMFSGFISTMMTAHLSQLVLASCALIGVSLTTILLVFISIVFSMSFITGQKFGAKQYAEMGRLWQEGMLLSFILGIGMMFCFAYVDTVLRWFHQDPRKLVYVHQYFHMLMWGAIPILLQCCLEQFFYGVLKQRIVITVNFISVLIGVPLAYGFIFGHFGFPDLGVKGLALTFVIQAWLCFIVLMLYAYFKSAFIPFGLFQKMHLKNWSYFRQIFRIGWPMSVQFGGELGAFFVVTMMIGWLGTDALAATQVVQQWMLLVVVPIFAMAEASGILVGQAVGARQHDQLNAIANASLLLSLALVAIVDIGFIGFPHFFASFYLNAKDAANKQIQQLIPPLFMLVAITLIFNSIRDVISGSLRGLFDTKFPMRVGLFVMWCLVIPLGYGFAFYFHLGVIGFRLGGNIGLLVGAMIVYWRWQSKIKAFFHSR